MRIRNFIDTLIVTALSAVIVVGSAKVLSATVVSPSIGSARAATVKVVVAGVKAPFQGKYVAHRDWYIAHPGFFWTSKGMGALLALSYLALAISLLWIARYVRRQPRLRKYNWIFVSFALFTLACSATRAMETVTIWWPIYRLLVAIKVLAAGISMAMVAAFTLKMPAATRGLGRFFDRLIRERQQHGVLRKGKDLLDHAGGLVGIGGWQLDLATDELTWSAETYRILGAAPDHHPILCEALAMHPVEARSVLLPAIKSASDGGPGWDLELPIVRFDGRQIWVRVVGEVEFSRGRPVRLTGALQDITNRRDERLALQKLNERFILATNSGGIGIWDWDIITGEFVCDAWMYRLHGLDVQDVPAPIEFWTENLHPDDRGAVVQALNDAIKGTKPYETDFRVLWKDGSVHRLRATGQVTRDDTGHAIRMVGTNCDISDSCRLAADLAEQHELLRVTLQSIGEGVITKDVSRNIIWMNAVAERLTGWSNAKAIGLPVTQVFKTINEKTRLPAGHPVASFITEKTIISAEPVLLVSRNRSECVIEGAIYPLRNTHQNMPGSVLVFRDVTEQRHLALETQHVATLQLELKLKDEFLSHVSHELRSPLTSIYSFSSIIADDLAGATTPEQQEYLHIILKNVVQLQAMIEDLLTVTRSREGKLGIDLQSVSVPEAIMDAVHTMQSAADEKHIALSAMNPSEMSPVCADATRLQQILIILIDNAVKFTPAGGQISVQASQTEDGFVLLQVSDTGCGIAAEDRTRVFESLYQVVGHNEADTSQAGRIGLGLGLHIAWDLVTRQGGRIWITGAPGEGSIFNVTLPIFREAPSTPALEPHYRRRKTDVSERKRTLLLPAA